MIHKAEPYNLYDDIFINAFDHIWLALFMGLSVWKIVDSNESSTQVKNMFRTNYIDKRIVRAYKVTRCTSISGNIYLS